MIDIDENPPESAVDRSGIVRADYCAVCERLFVQPRRRGRRSVVCSDRCRAVRGKNPNGIVAKARSPHMLWVKAAARGGERRTLEELAGSALLDEAYEGDGWVSEGWVKYRAGQAQKVAPILDADGLRVVLDAVPDDAPVADVDGGVIGQESAPWDWQELLAAGLSWGQVVATLWRERRTGRQEEIEVVGGANVGGSDEATCDCGAVGCRGGCAERVRVSDAAYVAWKNRLRRAWRGRVDNGV